MYNIYRYSWCAIWNSNICARSRCGIKALETIYLYIYIDSRVESGARRRRPFVTELIRQIGGRDAITINLCPMFVYYTPVPILIPLDSQQIYIYLSLFITLAYEWMRCNALYIYVPCSLLTFCMTIVTPAIDAYLSRIHGNAYIRTDRKSPGIACVDR